jgi:uncharacterized protein YcbK (DUF882 family)
VPSGFARQFNSPWLPKAGYHLGLTSLLLLAGAGAVHDATALNETRTLSFHHTHSDEDLTVTFKRDGRYDEEALKQLNHYLRDWRSQEQTTMDRHLFDILWEVYRDVDGKKPIQIISAYRSPATNAMLRRRSSGVARFSQHMLGHAMDFFIPDVPLEQIRYAGLRLQRGGVGFYPTSGSPFVHLDTGSIRHWPRMSHDQLARVFPDGRTVHVPSDGNPLPGYELARADIEKRGDGASPKGKPSFLAALFGAKPNDEDDEGASAPAVGDKAHTGGAALTAKSSETKSSETRPFETVPMPRAKPRASTIQLASVDVPIGQPGRSKPAPAEKIEQRPQTPADIINARGLWDDAPATPKQASPAQIAAINARRALSAVDPQPTASVATLEAFAYAPASSSRVDRSNIVAASVPVPHSARPTSVSRNPLAGTDVTTVAKGLQGGSSNDGSVIAIASRIANSRVNDVWMRAMILAPSASASMSTAVLGDTDMTLLRAHFVKPPSAIAMTFSDDPLMGIVSDSFTGSATAVLVTQSFVVRTAALR